MVMALWNKLTYHRRLFLGLVLYSVLLVSCVAIFQYYRERQFKVEELNLQLQTVNERLHSELADTDSVHASVESLSRSFPGLRISVIDSGGCVLYDNSLDSIPHNNHLGRKEIADAMRGGEGYSIRRHSESTGQTYFYSAMKGGKYIVRSAVPYSMSLQHLLAADFGFLWFMVGITFVMCVIGYFAIRKVGEHVRRLNRFAKKAEKGERISDAEPFPEDELGEISSHIVCLYARLQQAMLDRDREHRAAMREQQDKIRIKRQLTNNINHELKTPVASVKACLETVLKYKDMDAEKREEFLLRCYKANERLDRLLNDVSTITRLEDGSDNVRKEPIDVSEVISDVCYEFAPEADVHGMKIINNVDAPARICGNAVLMASIFRNLISNALSYSGGTRINITKEDAGENLIFTVSDDGCGVSSEHLPHIFERFYRIDKGRSRRAGGTGLGLSIVKNAVIWHEGSIVATNLRAGGLVFTITLPKQRDEGMICED